MAKDFRASQVETSRLIASGSIPGTTAGIIVYSGSIASDREGTTANPNLSTMLNKVGSDVFLFVSGTINSDNIGTEGTKSNVTLFGGDVVVSGTLYAERQVIEVDSTVPGNFYVTGNMFVEPDANSTKSVAFRQADGTDIFIVDATNKRIGINDSTPDAILDVVGGGSAGVPSLIIEHGEDTIDAIDITADSITTARVIDITADSLTEGNAIYVDDNSASTSTRNTVEIIQNNDAALAATALKVQSDGGKTGISIDKNYSNTTAVSAGITGLKLDMDRTGAVSTGTDNVIGADVDVAYTTATGGTTTAIGINSEVEHTHASGAGTSTVKAINLAATGGTQGTGTAIGADVTVTGADTNIGLQLNVEDGGTDIKVVSSADSDDFFSIATTANGATTITTVDDNVAAAHLTFNIDGNTDINAAGVVTIDGVGTSNVTTNGALTVSGSTALNLASDGGEIDLTTRLGNIDINATSGNVTIDSGGTFSIDGVGASNVTTNGALTLSGSTALNLASDSGEIDLTTRQGNIDLNATEGNITIDSGGSFSVDAVGTSNVTTNGALTISGSTGLNLKSDGGTLDIETRLGSIDIDSGGALTIDSGTSISIGATTDKPIDIDASTLDIDTSDDITITTGGSGKIIDIDASGQIQIDSAVSIQIGTNADKPINIDTNELDIDSSGVVTIDAVGNSHFTTNGFLTISGSTRLNLKSDAGRIDIESRQGLFSIDGVGNSNVTTNGNLEVSGSTGLNLHAHSGEIDITASQGAVDINADGGHVTIDATVDVDINAGQHMRLDSVGLISIDGTGTSNFTTNGAMTISGSTALNLHSYGGEIDITATQGNIDINATAGGIDVDSGGAITIDSSSTFSVDAVGTSNVTTNGALTVSGSTGLNLKSDSGTIDIESRQGQISIDGVGASNVTTNGVMTISGSTGLNLKADSGTIDIETRTGAIDIDAVGAITIDTTNTGTGVTIGTATNNVPISIGNAVTSVTTVNDKLNVSGDLQVAQYIKHTGDTDTFIQFQDDEIRMKAANKNFLKLDDSDGGVYVNNDFRNDIDFVVFSDTKIALAVKAVDDRVLIHTGGAASSFNEAASGDVAFYVSGSVFSRGKSTKGASLFGGDVHMSGVVGFTKLGSSPTAGANEAVLFAKDDSGITKLFMKQSDNQEIGPLGSGGSLDDSYNTPTGGGTKSAGAGAIIEADGQPVQIKVAGANSIAMAVTGSAIFGSGSSALNGNLPGLPGTDTHFFVSGSINKKGTSGVAVIGGELVVSGGIHSSRISAENNSSTFLDLDSTTAQVSANTIDLDAGTLTIDSTSTFSIDGVGASNVTTNGALTVSGSTGLNLKADSGTIDIETRTGAIDLDAAGVISIDSTNTATGITIGTATSGVPVSIGHTTSETTVNDNLNITGEVLISEFLKHTGDTDTLIQFEENAVKLKAANKNFLQFIDTESTLVINTDARNDISLLVKTDNKDAIVADAANDRVLFLSGGAAASFDEAKGSDVTFYVSGSIGHRGLATKGTSVFGGDLVVSGTLSVNRGQAGAGSAVTVTTEGKVGIGTDAPSYKLEVGGNASFGEYLYHRNNSGGQNTFMRFEDDKISFSAGNEVLLTITEDTQDIVTIGDGGDVDFQVRTDGDDNTLFVQGSSNRIGIGTNAPSSIVHIKESAPTLTIQRESNANNASIAFLGQAGATANMVHLASTNDLVFSTHDGSDQEEILRLGGHSVTDNRRVILLSGSAMAASAMQPSETLDVNFFVSGTIGHRGLASGRTAVLGGDLVVSGGIHMDFVPGADNTTKLSIGDPDKVYIKTPGSNALDLSGDSVRIGANVSSTTPYNPDDTNFFVSGAIGSRNTSTRGTSIFGGDVVISGSLRSAKTIDIKQYHANLNNGSVIMFLPAAGSQNIVTTNISDATNILAPFSGSISKILMDVQSACTIGFSLHKAQEEVPALAHFTASFKNNEIKEFNIAKNLTGSYTTGPHAAPVDYEFSGSYTFNPGDQLALGFHKKSGATPGRSNINIYFEYDTVTKTLTD